MPLRKRPEWTQDPSPAYQQFRAEGLSLGEAIWNAPSYLAKYVTKKEAAPPALVDHFRNQEPWFAHFASEQVASSQPGKGTLGLAMVGDLMWVRDSWSTFVTPQVLEHLNQHSVVLGNLETPISSKHPVPSLLPDAVHFNSPPELLTSFSRPDGSNTLVSAHPPWPQWA